VDVELQVQSRPLWHPAPLVHVEQPVASAPQASSWPTQLPLLSHVPVALHASRLTSQAPFAFFGVWMHFPVAAEQLPVLQSSVPLEQFTAVPLHTPLPHLSPVVQRFPSLHAIVLFLFWQPRVVLQESVVQGF